MINSAFVNPLEYDTSYYEPYIDQGRLGNVRALRKLTEWKNVGKGPRPRKLRKTQEKAFTRFVKNLRAYRTLGGKGKAQLRAHHQRNAPVWSIFWHHVLYGTPIFDVYTHMAYHWDITGDVLPKKEAKIHAPGHWPIFDRYCIWLGSTLKSLRKSGARITERKLDRALF